MKNSTQVSYFTLTAYIDTKNFKYLLFMIILILYLLIICTNILLIMVICCNRSLHEPMYLFLLSMLVNELFGSTSLFPLLLIQILSDVHTVSVPLCFLQIFCIHTYATVQFTNLAVMSYDRYVSICFPLQYNTLMTLKKVAVLVSAPWLTAFILVSVTTSLSFSLQLCGNMINKVYCGNYSVVKLACSDTRVINIYGIVALVFTVFVPVIFILYTYMRILKVCFSGSKETRQKAVSTCTPHLASLINYCFGVFFEILQNRFDMSRVPNMLRITLSLYLVICQPLFNPLMYGIKLPNIRNTCKRLLQHSSVGKCRRRNLITLK